MATRAEKAKLGIFLTVTVVLLAGALAVLTGSEVWEERWSYLVHFRQSVSGLEPGAPVKQRGVRVGFVDHIRTDPENVEQVKVTIKVQPGTPIKKDTQAFINMQGITGLKFIELKGGSTGAKLLEPGSEIPAGTSTLQELTGRATDISLKVEKVLNNLLVLTRPENREKVDSILSEGERAVSELNETAKEVGDLASATEKAIEDNRGPLYDAIKAVSSMSGKAEDTLVRVDGLTAQLGTIAQQAEVPEAVSELRATNQLVQERVRQLDADKAIDNVTIALKRLQRLLEQASETIGQNQHSLRVTIYNLRAISENLKELSRTFQEKPYIQLFGNDPKARDTPDD